MEVESKDKKKERLNKLKQLTLRMNEARKLNHQEVTDEDHRNKLPSNHEAIQARLQWQEEQEKFKKDCDAKGENYNIVKLRNVTASEVEKTDMRKKRKITNPGFSDYEQATFCHYTKLTKQIKPDLKEYKEAKEKMPEEMFYPTKNTLGLHEYQDNEAGVNRMVEDLEKQILKRGKYSRRRAHDIDADIDYINERNMNFNKKLERFYGKYTAEIKQNFERGTAI